MISDLDTSRAASVLVKRHGERTMQGPLILGWFREMFPATDPLGQIHPVPLRLLRTSVSSRDEFAKTVKDVLNDLVNAAGRDPDFESEIDLP